VLCLTQNFVVKVTLVWNPGTWSMTYGQAYCADLELFAKCTSRYGYVAAEADLGR
jgi:hypothetical protein